MVRRVQSRSESLALPFIINPFSITTRSIVVECSPNLLSFLLGVSVRCCFVTKRRVSQHNNRPSLFIEVPSDLVVEIVFIIVDLQYQTGTSYAAQLAI